MRYGFKDVVIDSRTGLNPRKNFVLGSGENHYITIKDIYNGQINITDKTDRVDDNAIQIIKKRSRIKIGDILFVSIGRIGETAIVTAKDDTWDVNESVFVLTINREIITPEYFCMLFKSDAVQKYLTGNSSGSTFKSIKMNQLEQMSFDLPPLAVQDEITTKLTRIQDICNQRKSELICFDQLIKARFVEMFGDPVANEKRWEKKPLLSMGTCKNGMNFHYDDSGVELNCLGVGDFKDYSVITDTAALPMVSLNEMPSSEYLLQDDDIVFVRSNGNKKMVGRSIAVYPGDIPTTFSGFCIRYRRTDNSVITPYMLRVLKAESMRQRMYGRGANIQNLNQQTLSSLDIPVPPKEMQERFAAFVSQVDKSKVVEFSVFTKRAKSYII